MEEEHPDDTMTGLVESEEVDESVLPLAQNEGGRTTEAAKDPFNHLRR